MISNGTMVDTAEATRRLNVKKQTLDDAYAAPANFLEIDILNPITHGVAKKRYTDYEVRMRVSRHSYLDGTQCLAAATRVFVCPILFICDDRSTVFRPTCQCLKLKNPVCVDVTVISSGYATNWKGTVR